MRLLLDQLKKETFIFYLNDSIPELPKFYSGDVHLIDDRTIEVTPSEEYILSDVFTELKDLNISIVSMRNKANRLEELFIDLVKKQ